MAFFPKIQSPCPYKGDLATVMDGSLCRMCKREVHDLTGWSDGERVAFLAGCETEVCVSYRIVRPALAAAALAAASLPAAAFAQDSAAPSAEAAAPAAPEQIVIEDIEVMVGGIADPANVEFVSAAELADIPEVPVAYEDEAPSPAAKPGA